MNILATVKDCVNVSVMKIEKHSPAILFGVGCVGVVATAVAAFKAYPRAQEVVAKHHTGMDMANEAADVAKPEDHYDIRVEKLRVCAETVKDMAITMAPTVALAAGTIVSFGVAFKVLNNRYLGAVAWGNAIADSFALYRSRVKDEFGEEMDQHFRYGTEATVTHKTGEDENGKYRDDGVELKDGDDAKIENLGDSDYARYFDASNDNWDPNPTFNLMFLRAQEKMANDKLHAQGHLFLNDVYDMLGFKDTPVGAVVGWVKGIGDDFVDFGLGRRDAEAVRTFINGDNNVVPLDFNVSGVIWDKI